MPVLGKNSVFKLDNQAGSLTDISAYVTDVTGVDVPTAMIDTTVFGNSSVAYSVGLKAGNTITVSGNYDSTPHTQFSAYTNSSTYTYEYSPAGTTAGLPKLTGEVRIVNYSLSSAVADVVKFTLTLQATGDQTWTTN